jgi:hypothetical protein
MKVFFLVLLTQAPFLIYLWLVPPEQRNLGQRLGAALITSVALGSAAWGAWQLYAGEKAAGRFWVGLGLCGLLLAVVRLNGWVGPRDEERY